MNIKNIIKMTLYKNIIKINRFRGIHLLLLYIYILCLSVCLQPINVKTVIQIGPKFVVGPYKLHDQKEVLWMLRIAKICLQQIIDF